MSDGHDELIKEYLIESQEHLANIETDLLAIEAAGANIDEILVNKVFRAAHSIKGGAGFFNLSKIQELAHKTENVLDMIRSRQMVPNPEIINILLLAFDKLREMIHGYQDSNTTDITEHVVALTGLTTAHLPQEQKTSVTSVVEVTPPKGSKPLKVSEFDLNSALKTGHTVYLIEFDMIHDVHRMGRNPLTIFNGLLACGRILECAVDLGAVGSLDDDSANNIPLNVVFASMLPLEGIPSVVDLPEDKIKVLHRPAEVQQLAAEPAAAPAATVEEAPASAPAVTPAAEPQAVTTPKAAPATTAAAGSSQVDSSLRVSVSLLETLMNLAGELVLSRNQLVEAIARNDTRSVNASGQRINLVTSELQETIMQTRMQPIGNILNKFPRVVRDLAKELKKDIQLQLSGKDVEMDKTIVEGLSDPLTHMVRNAVDHGVEAPEVRIRSGKPAQGKVTIKAYHEAGQVVVEIADDGKGLDPQKIANAALNKGLITKEQLKTMSAKEMMALVFLPGLSTAEKVTDVSGRGVGMDVVKTNLDKLGGKVEIESEIGKGTNFRIKLPLTLAIIPSLLVSVGGERFAVPQVNVNELIRISADQIQKRIEIVGDAEVLLLRGNLIPIVHLSDVLGIEKTFIDESGQRHIDRRAIADRRSPKHDLFENTQGDEDKDTAANRRTTDRRFHARSDMNIVVVTAGIFQYGLIVEELHDTVEIVVKPLGRHLKGLREYAGATIMGDGRVAIILDVAGIANKVSLTSLSGSTRAKELSEEAETAREKRQDVQSFLLFRNAPQEQCAVPLDLVARIEQVSGNQVEMIGGKRSMQYRGATLPLVTLSDAASVSTLADDQERVVVVFEISGKEIGLLAAMPVDVIETSVVIDQNTLKQKGIMGSAIINELTTMIIDIHELVETVAPELAQNERREKNVVAGEAPVVLLAEDSDFFRAQVRKFIESDGYQVIAGEDGQAAWEMLQEKGDIVKIVVTDIEMPRMTGLEFTQKIRGDQRFAHLPIIALTSLASEEDIAKGKSLGVSDYQIKLDKEKLLDGIRRLLNESAAA